MKGKRYWKRQFDIVMETSRGLSIKCAALRKENQRLENLLYKKVGQLIDALDTNARLVEKIEGLEKQ